MNEELIAPCGMNCAICSSYLAMKNDLKKKGVGRAYCTGCRPRGKNCAFMCRRLKALDKRYRTFYHMSMIDNLEYIKVHGMKQFLEKEMEKWRCPECGQVICCHNGICFECGLNKLISQKKRYRWADN